MYPGFFMGRSDLWSNSALLALSPRSHSTPGGCLIRDGGEKPCSHTPQHLFLIIVVYMHTKDTLTLSYTCT